MLKVIYRDVDSMGWMSEVLLLFMGQENSSADCSAASCQGDTADFLSDDTQFSMN